MRRVSPLDLIAMGTDGARPIAPTPIREQSEVARILGITPGMVAYHESAAMRKIAAAVAGISSMKVRDGAVAARVLVRSQIAAQSRRRDAR
jgi:hypothetical protein